MTLTGSEIEQIREVLRRYDRAIRAADAAAVTDLYTSYGAYLPAREPAAFGSDIQERYQSIFDHGRPWVGHELCEVATSEGLTLAVTATSRQHPSSTGNGAGRHLFALAVIEGQWKIVACTDEALEIAGR